MTKEQFNQMELLEQIQYINSELINTSLTQLCEQIGVNRSTVSKRFKSKGYVFDKSLNQFQEKEGNATDMQQGATKPKQNTTDTQQRNTTKSKDITINEGKWKALESQIQALEQRISILEANNIQASDSTDTQQGNNIRFYKGETIVRAYRIDEEVYRRFKHFTDDNKQFKISDIISTALENFLDSIE